MGLAGPGRTEQHDVLLAEQEVELCQVQHHVLLQRTLKGPVELLQGFAAGEARVTDAGLAAVVLTRAGLARKQRLGEALVAPLFAARALGELGQRARRGRCFERAEEVAKLGGGAHAGMSRSYRASCLRSTSGSRWRSSR